GGRRRSVHGYASTLSERGCTRVAEGKDRVRQVPRPTTWVSRSRRGPTPRVLPCRGRDARLRPWQALVAPAAMEDRARLQAGRASATVCRQSAVVQSLHPARATRSPVDLQDPRRGGALSVGLAEGLALATAARDR